MAVPFGLRAGETYRATNLARPLRERGYDVSVFLVPQHEYFLYEVPRRPTLVRGVPVYAPPYWSVRGIDTITRSISAPLSAVRRMGKPDIVHAFAPLPTSVLTGYLARKLYGCPWVQDAGDYMAAFTQHLNPIKRWATVQFEEFAYRSSDACTVTSHFLRVKALRSGSKRVRIVPNGVDLRQVRSLAGEVEKRENRVVYVGTFKRFVDLKTLFEAMRLVYRQNREAEFVVVGGGDMLPEFAGWLRKEGMLDRTRLTGFLPRHEDVLREILSSGIALLPLRDDARDWARCSMKMAEYLACGCAIVASNVGEARYWVKGAGLLVPPGDPKAMAEAVLRLMEDRKLLLKCRREAEKRAEELDWAKLARALEAVYREVLHT